ncbi:PepSY-like domain-containing protein [Marinoscillum pacificum]|uniref:PepSY-like domain-containing protein n=1 Tax=Marinoscillum pacificum TaxID=392723 RepID=UPI002157B030|nr:PepSY-like domain-containing protein [Marinoscillum pacificum]
MKKILGFTMLAGVIGLTSCSSREGNVPQKVLESFKSKFPGSKMVEWEMEDETEWEAEFEWKGKEYSANFSTAGDWVETEYEIEESEVPTSIIDVLNANFEQYEIEEVEIAETVKGQVYEFELEVGEEELEVAVNLKGEVTKKVIEEHEESDKD